jgi:hypothetical protein
MRYLYQAVYAVTLISAGAAGSFVWMRQIDPQLTAHPVLHSVSWYKEHPDDMLRDDTWCRDNPGVDEPNCDAAGEAKLQADFGAVLGKVPH